MPNPGVRRADEPFGMPSRIGKNSRYDAESDRDESVRRVVQVREPHGIRHRSRSSLGGIQPPGIGSPD